MGAKKTTSLRREGNNIITARGQVVLVHVVLKLPLLSSGSRGAWNDVRVARDGGNDGQINDLGPLGARDRGT